MKNSSQVAMVEIAFNPSEPFDHVHLPVVHGTDMQCLDYLFSEANLGDLKWVELLAHKTFPDEEGITRLFITKKAVEWISKTAIGICNFTISLKQHLIKTIHDAVFSNNTTDHCKCAGMHTVRKMEVWTHAGHADQEQLVIVVYYGYERTLAMQTIYIPTAGYHVTATMTTHPEFKMDAILVHALKGAYSSFNSFLESCYVDGKPATPKMKDIQKARAVLPQAYSMAHNHQPKKTEN